MTMSEELLLKHWVSFCLGKLMLVAKKLSFLYFNYSYSLSNIFNLYISFSSWAYISAFEASYCNFISFNFSIPILVV